MAQQYEERREESKQQTADLLEKQLDINNYKP